MAASVTTVLTNSFAGQLLPKARRGRSAELTLQIANMHCDHCLDTIKQAVSGLQGVEEVRGNPEQHIVTVTFREGMVEPDGIREAIIERGFKPI
jgi:copper chaperone CopZ